MKKFAVYLAAVVFFVVMFAAIADASTGSGPYAANTEEFIGGMGKRFIRGVINTFTGWVEIPVQIAKGYKRGFGGDPDNKAAGAFVGIFDGVWQGLGRTFAGFRDMAGFWAADHRTNDGVGIPLDAEYAWEDGTPYSLTKPSFSQATVEPMGNKLIRGVSDLLFGVLELPGQITKGIRIHAPDAGVVKGIWYFCSRTLDGAYDAATFLVPNPKDTTALAFDEKWPWDAMGENIK
jgi:putative exosortase-associated protein (TIGR04073 family)